MNELIHLRTIAPMNSGQQDFIACNHEIKEHTYPYWCFSIKNVTCPECLKIVGKTFTKIIMVVENSFQFSADQEIVISDKSDEDRLDNEIACAKAKLELIKNYRDKDIIK